MKKNISYLHYCQQFFISSFGLSNGTIPTVIANSNKSLKVVRWWKPTNDGYNQTN